MLTVKHIDSNGKEAILEAKEVYFLHEPDPHPYDPNVPQAPEEKTPNVKLQNGFDIKTIYYGKVYVMNEHGKTVASYEMLPLCA